MPKTRAQILALLAPKPKPAPAPCDERAHTLRLLNTLAAVAIDIAEKAHDFFLVTHRIVGARPDPYAPFQRVTRAISRLMMLILRLREATPLPARTPLRPKYTRPIKPPAPPIPPAALKPALKPTPAKPKRRRARDPVREDIERLLRTKSPAEIVALICRDLGLSPDPATWPAPQPLAPTSHPLAPIQRPPHPRPPHPRFPHQRPAIPASPSAVQPGLPESHADPPRSDSG